MIARAWNRARGISTRARERARGVPIRLANRGRGPAIPPSRLIRLVAGTEDVAWFLDSGAVAARGVRSLLQRHGVEIDRLGAVLDFGCGVGRVLRHWADFPGPAIHGTDYNPVLIAWCRRNLPFARFGVNGLGDGLDHDDATFDLVYAFSVFTHLTEHRQEHWMGELGRILKPGGHLLFSVHGAFYLPGLDSSEQARFEHGRLVVRGARREGRNECAAFHPKSYVTEVMARDWQVVDFLPEGAEGNPRQDVYLLRKPGPLPCGQEIRH